MLQRNRAELRVGIDVTLNAHELIRRHSFSTIMSGSRHACEQLVIVPLFAPILLERRGASFADW